MIDGQLYRGHFWSLLASLLLSNLKREAVIERHYCYDGVQLRGTSRSAASSVAVLQVTIMTFNHGFAF